MRGFEQGFPATVSGVEKELSMDFPLILVVPLAFVCEFVDSSLGMGYGTALTPLLLLLGFEPLQVVPAVLCSEFVTGIMAAVTHHRAENVDLRPSSKDAKVALVLSLFSVVGVLISVVLAVSLPKHILKIAIGVIVVSMGVYLIAGLGRQHRFSWLRIMTLGTVAAFNKGMSGGGYGPLVTGGQMLSGVGVKNAVAITSLAEGLTCLVGVITFFVLKRDIDWTLAPWLMAGGVMSVPFAVHTLKRLPERYARVAVAVVVLLLGGLALSKGLTHA